MQSDLSGDALEGSAAPAPIVVEFDDGTRRELTVTAAEASKLKRAGDAASNWYSWSRLWPVLRKLGLFVLAAWFASIVIPALVQQWADRTKELELKSTLVTQISDAASELTNAAVVLEAQLLPEDRAARDAFDELAAIKKDAGPNPTRAEKKAIALADAALKKAQQAERRTDQKLINDTRNRWNRESASLRAQLHTYYDAGVAETWASYTRVGRDFLRLSTNVTEEDRKTLQNRVLAFLERPRAVSVDEPFPDYREVADRLLEDRYLVLSHVIEGNADGFNTGKGDLFRRIFFLD
jgi:hypothetical protein